MPKMVYHSGCCDKKTTTHGETQTWYFSHSNQSGMLTLD